MDSNPRRAPAYRLLAWLVVAIAPTHATRAPGVQRHHNKIDALSCCEWPLFNNRCMHEGPGVSNSCPCAYSGVDVAEQPSHGKNFLQGENVGNVGLEVFWVICYDCILALLQPVIVRMLLMRNI